MIVVISLILVSEVQYLPCVYHIPDLKKGVMSVFDIQKFFFGGGDKKFLASIPLSGLILCVCLCVCVGGGGGHSKQWHGSEV